MFWKWTWTRMKMKAKINLHVLLSNPFQLSTHFDDRLFLWSWKTYEDNKLKIWLHLWIWRSFNYIYTKLLQDSHTYIEDGLFISSIYSVFIIDIYVSVIRMKQIQFIDHCKLHGRWIINLVSSLEPTYRSTHVLDDH